MCTQHDFYMRSVDTPNNGLRWSLHTTDWLIPCDLRFKWLMHAITDMWYQLTQLHVNVHCSQFDQCISWSQSNHCWSHNSLFYNNQHKPHAQLLTLLREIHWYADSLLVGSFSEALERRSLHDCLTECYNRISYLDIWGERGSCDHAYRVTVTR